MSSKNFDLETNKNPCKMKSQCICACSPYIVFQMSLNKQLYIKVEEFV